MDGYGVEDETLVATGEDFSDLAEQAGQAVAEFAGKADLHDDASEGFTTRPKLR